MTTPFTLADFGLTKEHGFLCQYDASETTLPKAFDPIQQAGDMLPGYLASGCVRTYLDKVTEIELSAFDGLTDEQLRWLMVRYSFIIQGYIWGEKEAAQVLPKNLAVPYCYLAEKLDMFPLLPYSGYTLDNWAKLDKSGDITLENIYVLQNFLGGLDENWFIMVHVEIEAKAGRALAAIPELLAAAKDGDEATALKQLQEIRSAWEQINPVFDRMVESCDPYCYFHRVRPYIHGWKDNPAFPAGGVIYEGVEKFKGKPQAFRGQTGSQSSIVPTMDALFGVAHQNDPLREYLAELHHYRPRNHREFIEAVQKESTVREFVQKCNNQEMIEVYNDCLTFVADFRTRHLEYAASYINKQSSDSTGNDTEVGTGGTPFMRYLKKHRNENREHLLAHILKVS
jgi:indoleamine 2,3-dioxygenase